MSPKYNKNSIIKKSLTKTPKIPIKNNNKTMNNSTHKMNLQINSRPINNP